MGTVLNFNIKIKSLGVMKSADLTGSTCSFLRSTKMAALLVDVEKPHLSMLHFLKCKKFAQGVCVFEYVLVFPLRKLGTFALFELPALWWGTYLLKIKSYLLEVSIRF